MLKFLCVLVTKTILKQKVTHMLSTLYIFTVNVTKNTNILFIFVDLTLLVRACLLLQTILAQLEKKCFCDKVHANEICQYCISIRYSLNFLCHKICVEDSEYFRDFLKTHKATRINRYLRKLPCEPFFFFEDNRVFINLDNPAHCVPHKTDSRPVLYRS